MRSRLLQLLLPVLAIVAISAGCGGDDDPGESASADRSSPAGAAEGAEGAPEDAAPPEPITTSSLPKAQYLKRANTLCKREEEAREREARAFQESGEGSLDERTEKLLQDIYLPSVEDQLAALRELGAPRGDARQVEAIIAGFEEWVDNVRQQQEGAGLNKALNREAFVASNRARDYGLAGCVFG